MKCIISNVNINNNPVNQLHDVVKMSVTCKIILTFSRHISLIVINKSFAVMFSTSCYKLQEFHSSTSPFTTFTIIIRPFFIIYQVAHFRQRDGNINRPTKTCESFIFSSKDIRRKGTLELWIKKQKNSGELKVERYFLLSKPSILI